MNLPNPINILFCLVALSTLAPLADAQNGASQLGFTALQTQANSLVEKGQLIEALPLLTELVKRVEASEQSDIQLDFPVFLIGTAYIQKYVASGQESELQKLSFGTTNAKRVPKIA